MPPGDSRPTCSFGIFSLRLRRHEPDHKPRELFHERNEKQRRKDVESGMDGGHRHRRMADFYLNSPVFLNEKKRKICEKGKYPDDPFDASDDAAGAAPAEIAAEKRD